MKLLIKRAFVIPKTSLEHQRYVFQNYNYCLKIPHLSQVSPLVLAENDGTLKKSSKAPVLNKMERGSEMYLRSCQIPLSF